MEVRLVVWLLCLCTVVAFNVNVGVRQPFGHACSGNGGGNHFVVSSRQPRCTYSHGRGGRGSTTTMMVFDFFKKRAEEGIQQAANFQKKTAEGKLGEAFGDVGSYVKERQDAVAIGLAKSRERLIGDLNRLIGASDNVQETLQSLEDVLITADIGMATTTQIISDLRTMAKMQGEKPLDPDDIKSVLRGTLVDALKGEPRADGRKASALTFNTFVPNPNASTVSPSPNPGDESTPRIDQPTSPPKEEEDGLGLGADGAPLGLGADGAPLGLGDAAAAERPPPSHQPTVLFVMGANGMGKTTTIGKMAYRLRVEGGQKVLLAAADTFRAAAVEQLEEWAELAGVDIVGPERKEERPSTVTYRACEKAINEKYDVLIVDTSGRLSNNKALNEELNKMKRVIAKAVPGGPPGSELGLGLPGPHETLLVVDAAVGRNAVDQARVWKKDVGLTGLIVTKLDGTARAGFTVSISSDLGIPVKLIGVGEKITDLRDFEPEEFVDALLGYSKEEAARLAAKFNENPLLKQRMEDKLAADKRAREEKLRSPAIDKVNVSRDAVSAKARRRSEKKAQAGGKPKKAKKPAKR